MEDTATIIDTGTAPEAQSTDTDSAAPEATATQAAKPAGNTPSIQKLLEREKNDPNFRMTDAEQDVYDAYIDKLDSKPKTKAPKEEPEEEEPEETPVSKTKEEPEEKEEPEAKEDPEPEEEADDSEAKAILKELGAKSLKDAAAKLKDLKRLVGGKDAQAVARITKENQDLIRGQRELMSALAKGDPKAMAFAEKTFGLKFGGQQKPEQPQPVSEGDEFIPADQFIDPDSAKLVNAAFKRQADMIKALEAKFGTIEEERDRHIQDTVQQQSKATVVDEMAKIAQRIPDLKGIAGFREAAQAILDGKSDPRLEKHFSELFEIASKIPGATLLDAYDIKRGRDSDRIEAEAVQKGLKQAYNQKPNPSLSGQTGGKGEASYSNLTDADIEAFENGTKPIPESWFDKNDELVQSKVPKRAWKAFGFK